MNNLTLHTAHSLFLVKSKCRRTGMEKCFKRPIRSSTGPCPLGRNLCLHGRFIILNRATLALNLNLNLNLNVILMNIKC